MLARVLGTELLKLKRTLALYMVVLAPAVVVLLNFLVGYLGPVNARAVADPWPRIVQQTVNIWTVLMMPMFVTLETSLLAGLEHTDKNWKSLLALPAPRWTVYLAKLIVTIGLVWVAMAILAVGTEGSVNLLKYLRPELKVIETPWLVIVKPLAKIGLVVLFAVTIQHWVSLRWQSFTAALGFGMAAMVTSFVALNSNTWGPRWPWSMPLFAIRTPQAIAAAGGTDQTAMLIAIGIAGAIVVAAVGCWEFTRREITN